VDKNALIRRQLEVFQELIFLRIVLKTAAVIRRHGAAVHILNAARRDAQMLRINYNRNVIGAPKYRAIREQFASSDALALADALQNIEQFGSILTNQSPARSKYKRRERVQ
jgi:hypothetical protein